MSTCISLGITTLRHEDLLRKSAATALSRGMLATSRRRRPRVNPNERTAVRRHRDRDARFASWPPARRCAGVAAAFAFAQQERELPPATDTTLTSGYSGPGVVATCSPRCRQHPQRCSSSSPTARVTSRFESGESHVRLAFAPVTPGPKSRCAICGGWAWWRSASGSWHCWRCVQGPAAWQHDPAIKIGKPNSTARSSARPYNSTNASRKSG
jgi:hypothetical protein